MSEADKRRELEERISKAQSIEEVKSMLAENGTEMSDEQAELLHVLAQQIYDPIARNCPWTSYRLSPEA